MRKRKILPILSAAWVSMLAPAFVHAQAVPLTAPIPLCFPTGAESPGDIYCREPVAVALADGRFAVAATLDFNSSISYSLSTESTFVDLLDDAGRPAGGGVLDRGYPIGDSSLYRPALAADGSGGFLAVWNLGLWDDDVEIWARRFDPAGAPMSRDPFHMIGAPGGRHTAPRIAANSRGQFVMAWEFAEPDSSGPTTISVQIFESLGQPASLWIHIAPQDPKGILTSPRVAIDSQGRVSVLWVETTTTGGVQTTVLRGQRFRRNGRLLGPAFVVPKLGLPTLLPDGRFVLAFQEPGGDGHLRLGWYSPNGVPAGSVVDTGASGKAVDLATDRQGHLALLTGVMSRLEVRLFDRELVPRGEPFRVGHLNPGSNVEGSVALSERGRLLVSWVSPRFEVPDGFVIPVVARLWKVSF